MYGNIEFLWKTGESGNGDCPSLMKVEGGYIGVGRILDGDTLAQIHAVGRANNSGIGAGETAVFIPADVIDRIRELG
jgi:hypothetical protein